MLEDRIRTRKYEVILIGAKTKAKGKKVLKESRAYIVAMKTTDMNETSSAKLIVFPFIYEVG